MSDSWFEVVSGDGLMQGDVLIGCPIYRVVARSSSEGDEAEVLEESHDVIVLTQSCDLENDKVDEILVAAVLSCDEIVKREADKNPSVKGTSFRKAAVAGNLPPYSLLPRREAEPALPWSLVDFHNLFSLPKSLAAEVAVAAGERLRLVPPYREHLAQAFARYIMRVGLPSTLRDFEGYAPA